VKSFSSFLPNAVRQFYPGLGTAPTAAWRSALRVTEPRNLQNEGGNEEAA
jgi:hypothetical protein